MMYLLRNPVVIRMTFVQSTFVALLVLALFWKVADTTRPILVEDIFKDTFNWMGLSFMLTSNIMIPSIQNVVMQMPMQVPVFKRELMNHMYTPTAYFFARTLSGILIQVCAPILMTLIIFFGLGLPVTAFTFLNFFTNTVQVALVGCAIGYMCGLVFEDDNLARGFSMFMTLVFMLVSGSLNIALNYPIVIDQLQYVSPNRYSVETFFRILSDG